MSVFNAMPDAVRNDVSLLLGGIDDQMDDIYLTMEDVPLGDEWGDEIRKGLDIAREAIRSVGGLVQSSADADYYTDRD